MSRSWIVGVAAVLAATIVIPPASAGEQMLLPDLRQSPVGCPGGYPGNPAGCKDWDVCMVTDPNAASSECVTKGDIRAIRLRFTSAEENVGDGPLVLYGHRDDARTATMQVRQAIQATRNGPVPGSWAEARQPTATSMYYEPATMHQHWHLMGFERMQLRTPKGGVVVSDRKNGFCLGDRYAIAYGPVGPEPDDGTTEGALTKYLRDNMCGYKNTSVLDMKTGISVGSGDEYDYEVDYQWLDITGLPTGTYDIVNTVNADRTLLETDYTNNSSAIAISVRWPKGSPSLTQPPFVTLLRSCPGQNKCATSEGFTASPAVSSATVRHQKTRSDQRMPGMHH
jgi:hypothetical protein